MESEVYVCKGGGDPGQRGPTGRAHPHAPRAAGLKSDPGSQIRVRDIRSLALGSDHAPAPRRRLLATGDRHARTGETGIRGC
eukprot:4242385-Prymnesium_polylepis.1